MSIKFIYYNTTGMIIWIQFLYSQEGSSILVFRRIKWDGNWINSGRLIYCQAMLMVL